MEAVSTGRKVEVVLRIREDGQVELEVKGQRGPGCVDVARAFDSLGEIVEESRTGEFYQGSAGTEVTTRRRS